MKRIRLYSFVALAILAILSILLLQQKKASLDTWIGEYRYTESLPAGPPDNPSERFGTIDYNVTIYKDDANYLAKIINEGYQTDNRILAKVVGDSDNINLLFDSYLPNNIGGNLNKDDVLLSFTKEDNILYTAWNAIQSNTSISGGEKMGIYFKKLATR